MSDSEETTYLKPSGNPHLIGHQAAEERFLAAWKSGRLPHGWLITGPRGIGKATFAFRVARFVLSGGGAEQPASLFGDSEPEGLFVDPENPVMILSLFSDSLDELFDSEMYYDPFTGQPDTISDVTDFDFSSTAVMSVTGGRPAEDVMLYADLIAEVYDRGEIVRDFEVPLLVWDGSTQKYEYELFPTITPCTAISWPTALTSPS